LVAVDCCFQASAYIGRGGVTGDVDLDAPRCDAVADGVKLVSAGANSPRVNVFVSRAGGGNPDFDAQSADAQRAVLVGHRTRGALNINFGLGYPVESWGSTQNESHGER
jgi:hypothetical protein